MFKPNRALMGTTIGATLALLPQLAAAQPSQPPAASGAFTRPDDPGRPAVPDTAQDHTQAMERLFQAAQRLRGAVQEMAQQPPGERRNRAMAQARDALLGTQQAMVQLPPELRTGQDYRDAETRAGEAGRALGDGQGADPQRAQAAADAILVLVPRLRDDAGEAASAAAAPGAPLARATSLLDTTLLGPGGDKEVARLENLMVDRQGNARAAVVEWGGFLGIGERRALVPVERIRFGASQDGRARIDMTREQLERLPRFDRDRLADYGREHGWGEGVRWFR